MLPCVQKLVEYLERDNSKKIIRGIDIKELITNHLKLYKTKKEYEVQLGIREAQVVDRITKTINNIGEKRARSPNSENEMNLENTTSGKRPPPLGSSGGKNKNLRSNKKRMPPKSSPKPKSDKPTYKKTARKYTDSKGKKCTIYTKNGKEYVKKLSKSTGKFVYRAVKA